MEIKSARYWRATWDELGPVDRNCLRLDYRIGREHGDSRGKARADVNTTAQRWADGLSAVL